MFLYSLSSTSVVSYDEPHTNGTTTMTSDEYDLAHSAQVGVTIPILEKLIDGKGLGFSAYYMAGSLILDMEDIITGAKFVALTVRPIEELEQGDEWRQQYLISRIYVLKKSGTCVFHKQAESNIQIFENA